MPPSALDHLLVAVLSVFFPIRAATFGYRRLNLAPPERVADLRRALYFQAIAIQWGLSVAALAIWLWSGRGAAALGLAPRDPMLVLWGLLGAAVIALVLWLMRRRVRGDPEALDRILQRLDRLERMLPRTRGEVRLFQLVSLTAGICEELLYRGYLIWYLRNWLPILPALVASSAIFGIGHSYQGGKGIAATGFVGALMAMIYLGTGALWPAMAVHAIIDMHTGELGHAALRRRESAALAAEVGGRAPGPDSS